MVARNQIESYLATLLAVERFKDYGPNGLQVEGRAEVTRLVSGVTASRALIDAAIEARADAILVHHGLFWRGQDGRLTGWLAERVKRLMAHGINLFAYHLPLDAHAEFGNPNCALLPNSACASSGKWYANRLMPCVIKRFTRSASQPVRRPSWPRQNRP